MIAIDNLQLRCGSIENSSLTYDSVIDGCQAQNWKNYLSEWSNTVATSIDYNVAALTVCMSVDTPPPKLCPKFFVVGSLIYCKKSSAKVRILCNLSDQHGPSAVEHVGTAFLY